MKIAYVIGECCPGGVVSYACEYSRRLLAAGHKVDFYVYAASNPEWLSFVEGCSSNVCQVPPIRHLKRYYDALKQLFLLGTYDVVHSFMNTLNFPSMLAAKKAAVPVRIAENLSTGSRHEPKSLIKAMLKPLGGVGATAIAANSELAAAWLYGDNDLFSCSIIPNPIDCKKFYYDERIRSRFRSDLGLSDEIAIGCIARFERQKNLPFLVRVFNEACKVNPNARLFLVGHGSMEGDLRSLIDRNGLQSKVSLLDPDVDRNAFYNAMDVFVLPSIYEGMPIVVLEAEATGLPCLLSAEITRECSLGGMCSYLALSEDVNTWASAALDMANGDWERSRTDRMEGSRFDADYAVVKLELLYRGLLAQSSERV